MNNARKILKLNQRWNELDSNAIMDNVEAALEQKGITSFGGKMEKLIEITNSSKHAVYSWINRSRTDVKIPFLKLCMIADALKINIEELLIGGNNMFIKKFAVSKLVENDEKILKYFGADEKEAAIAYGAEVAKSNKEGVITCFRAKFDENGNIKDNEMEIFEIWR